MTKNKNILLRYLGVDKDCTYEIDNDIGIKMYKAKNATPEIQNLLRKLQIRKYFLLKDFYTEGKTDIDDKN